MLVDIDRHILLDLAENSSALTKHLKIVAEETRAVLALYERNTALIMHLVREIKAVDTGNGKEKGQG
jgi:hypothetical protein